MINKRNLFIVVIVIMIVTIVILTISYQKCASHSSDLEEQLTELQNELDKTNAQLEETKKELDECQEKKKYYGNQSEESGYDNSALRSDNEVLLAKIRELEYDLEACKNRLNDMN